MRKHWVAALAIVALAFLITAIIVTLGAIRRVDAQVQKLPEGERCANVYGTDDAHRCDCMAGMSCPMDKEHGPDSTRCKSPNCKKESCTCANPCRS